MGSRDTFYRLKAEHCATLAKTMTDGLSRRELEKAAARWLSLVKDAEVLGRIERDGRLRLNDAAE